MKFELLDKQQSDERRFLGQVIINSEELFNSVDNKKTVEVMSLDDKVCDLTIEYKIPAIPTRNLLFTMEGVNLKYHTTWFSRADTRVFFRLCKYTSEGEYLEIYESKTLQEVRNPKWEAIRLKSSIITKEFQKNPVKIQILYYENDIEKLFGEADFICEEVINRVENLNLTDKAKNRQVGNIRIKCQVVEKMYRSMENFTPSKVNVMLGIDFSDSQKKMYRFPSTHTNAGRQDNNEYQNIITGLFDSLFVYFLPA